jgi:hypothetical protein
MGIGRTGTGAGTRLVSWAAGTGAGAGARLIS